MSRLVFSEKKKKIEVLVVAIFALHHSQLQQMKMFILVFICLDKSGYQVNIFLIS